jgi:dTDP-4-dehydrorhamnose 3,5-epimerase
VVRASRATPALVLNLVDRPYRYEDPDRWRLPPDTPEIPYRFTASGDALA